jgi:hypothetical protein
MFSRQSDYGKSVSPSSQHFAAFCFVIIFIASLEYERRAEQVSESAFQYRAIVANLFPAVVRGRLFRKREGNEREARKRKSKKRSSSLSRTGTVRLIATRRRRYEAG